jgi:phage terminase small subunit
MTEDPKEPQSTTGALRTSEVSPHNAVAIAIDKEELKLLTRDEQKEYKVLRELLTTMTSMQIRFVEAYVKTASAAQAARMAGSKSANPEIVGYTMLKNPKVQQAIAIAMKKRIEAVGLDTIEVITKIREVYNHALNEKNYTAAIKACELLQKEIDKANGPQKKNAVGEQLEKDSGGGMSTKAETSEEKDEALAKVISILNRA